MVEPSRHRPIPDPPATLLADDQTRINQDLQVMGHRGLGSIKWLHQLADARFPGRRRHHEAQEAKANGVGQHGKIIG